MGKKRSNDEPKNPAAQALIGLRWAKDKVRDQPREAGKLGGRERKPAHPYDPKCRCVVCREKKLSLRGNSS